MHHTFASDSKRSGESYKMPTQHIKKVSYEGKEGHMKKEGYSMKE